MKRKQAVLAGVVAIVATGVVADDKHHEGSSAKTMPGGTGMLHEGGMPMVDMKTMEEHMEQMQATLNKARASKDPNERQALLQKHMQEMHTGMDMMNHMGGMMMPQSAGGAMGGGPEMAPGSKQMQQQHEVMQQRMDMMQKMMQHMMDQQALMMEK